MAIPVNPGTPSQPPPSGPSPAQRWSKRRPRARLRAGAAGQGPVADWASLFGDLARRPAVAHEVGAPVEWRVHDRTHIEFAIDYPFQRGGRAYTWEAFFFVPESFRLQDDTYDKKAIYNDLWSYVRYAVPDVPFVHLASIDEGSWLARLAGALAVASSAPGEAMRMLRLFACLVRASGLSAMREVDAEVNAETRSDERILRYAVPFLATCDAVAGAFRKVLAEAEPRLPDDVRTAARWTDEDVSIVLETFCASLAVAIEERGAEGPLHELAEQLGAYAVEEARHRRDRGYDSLGAGAADERAIEHLEFRRHFLKRFTSSVLWLSTEVREAAAWVLHALYAIAAAMAMAFAFVASVRTTPTTENIFRYGLLVVLAYAVKDRMKAFLQSVFAGWIAKRFPDRRWAIRDRERDHRIGDVHERAGFLPFRKLPDEVLRMRRATREHALEEHARPERVLWHKKTIGVSGEADQLPDFPMLTEIFRLNLRPWLAHADDPNRKIVFADPSDERIYQATARRVYNINIVYRMCAEGAAASWHRIRVVVSRKGIERIEAIDTIADAQPVLSTGRVARTPAR